MFNYKLSDDSSRFPVEETFKLLFHFLFSLTRSYHFLIYI